MPPGTTGDGFCVGEGDGTGDDDLAPDERETPVPISAVSPTAVDGSGTADAQGSGVADAPGSARGIGVGEPSGTGDTIGAGEADGVVDVAGWASMGRVVGIGVGVGQELALGDGTLGTGLALTTTAKALADVRETAGVIATVARVDAAAGASCSHPVTRPTVTAVATTRRVRPARRAGARRP